MKKIIGIYKLTSPSGKCYVGQSINIYARWAHHKREKRHWHRKLFNAIRKYGFDSFKREILEECNADLLDEREKFWIEYYDSCISGYNCDSGGQKRKIFSRLHRERLRQAFLGVYNGSQNIRFSIDGIEYFSIGAASKQLGIPAKTIHNRLNSPNIKFSNYCYLSSGRQIIRAKPLCGAKGIIIDKVFYSTIREAAETLKIPATSLWRKSIKQQKESLSQGAVHSQRA